MFNPLNWFRAWRFQRQQAVFDKSQYDLELYLYAHILKNDMLHYGYFDDADIAPESISLQSLEDAQRRYADKIIGQVQAGPVLDIGSGMGGLAQLLHQQGYAVEALTPNANQVQHIRHKYPQLVCHQNTFENFTGTNAYATLINAESLQYIQLKPAFEKAEQLLLPGGRWIITDYFRISDDGVNRSGHRLQDFLNMADAQGWKILVREDMTAQVLPTLKVVQAYVDRFLWPLKHFGEEKLRYKKAWLYFLSGPLREQAGQKIHKELAAVDPERFIREKKYLLFVLEK